MKEIINKYIEDHKEEFYQLGKELFENPELGFKEFKTKEIINRFLQTKGLSIDKEFAQTGFTVKIGQGKPNIGLICELDGIPTINHPYASKVDNAAHSCGHSSQVTIMLAAICALKEVINKYQGTVTLFFTPAEEFTDIAYRKQLIQQGKIKYLSGKENMIEQHLIDDIDLFIHLHGSGQYCGHHFSIGSKLAGFTYKKITFKGKSAHAAVNPSEGVNAANMCVLFLNAVNMLRETFKEEDLVRFHGMISKGGTTVNSIPEEVEYECYCRSINPQYLLYLSNQVDKIARCCAEAFNGSVEIEQQPGYLPLIPDERLSKVVYNNMLNFFDDSQILHDEKSCAAGDVGDISIFKPIIQYGYTGFSGNMHGNNLLISDPYEVYIIQPKVVCGSVIDLLEQPELVNDIVNNFKPKMTYQQYIDYLNNK